MLALTVGLATDSGLFQRVIVSTDDSEIAAIASEAGAEVPFLRECTLADDTIGLLPVVQHAIEEIGANTGDGNPLLCCLLPTAALINKTDLLRSYTSIRGESRKTFLTAATEYPHPIERALRMDAGGNAIPNDANALSKRTQDCQELWHDAGQFYWAHVATWLAATSILANTLLFPIPRSRSVDLDTEEDWKTLERLYISRLGSCADD